MGSLQFLPDEELGLTDYLMRPKKLGRKVTVFVEKRMSSFRKVGSLLMAEEDRHYLQVADQQFASVYSKVSRLVVHKVRHHYFPSI